MVRSMATWDSDAAQASEGSPRQIKRNRTPLTNMFVKGENKLEGVKEKNVFFNSC